MTTGAESKVTIIPGSSEDKHGKEFIQGSMSEHTLLEGNMFMDTKPENLSQSNRVISVVAKNKMIIYIRTSTYA